MLILSITWRSSSFDGFLICWRHRSTDWPTRSYVLRAYQGWLCKDWFLDIKVWRLAFQDYEQVRSRHTCVLESLTTNRSYMSSLSSISAELIMRFESFPKRAMSSFGTRLLSTTISPKSRTTTR